jgi:hypothetical protein
MKTLSLIRAFLTLAVIVGPLPVTLTNGTTADATQVMQDLNWLMNQINANAASTTGTPSLAQLAASNGSTLIGTIQGGAGATATTVAAFINRYPSVVDYGAVSGTDCTTAFTAAQTAWPNGFIEVPVGFTCTVQGNLNYWLFFGKGTVQQVVPDSPIGGALPLQARVWSLSPYPQTGAPIKGYNPLTYGSFENAVAASFTASTPYSGTPWFQGQAVFNTQAAGTSAQGLATIPNFEHPSMAIYASCYPRTPVALSGATTTFTATSVTHANISSTNTLPGMYIDIWAGAITGNPAFIGGVKSVAGTTATVDGWYAFGTGVAGTPAAGKLGLVNFQTKGWGLQIVTESGSASPATLTTGIEIDVFTGGTSGSPSLSPVSGTWGFDCWAADYSYMDVAYQARGKRNYSFFSNNSNATPAIYAFVSKGDGVGIEVDDATLQAIQVTQGGLTKFVVAPNGLTVVAGLIIGGTSSPASGAAGTAGTVTFDANFGYYCVASGTWKRWPLTGGY